MRNYIEDKIHKAVVDMILLCFPNLLFTHPANQGRSPQEGAKLKKMGVRAGVGDLIFWWILEFGCIEIKSKTGTLLDSQKIFYRLFTAIGGKYAVCRSVREAYDTLVSWGHKPLYNCPREPDLSTKEDKIKAAINLYQRRK